VLTAVCSSEISCGDCCIGISFLCAMALTVVCNSEIYFAENCIGKSFLCYAGNCCEYQKFIVPSPVLVGACLWYGGNSCL